MIMLRDQNFCSKLADNLGFVKADLDSQSKKKNKIEIKMKDLKSTRGNAIFEKGL